ncbi:MAG: universal stress protein [Cyclobacteriaceae bacterium]
MKKILVPVDFSEVSNNAVDFAVNLAEKFNAELTLMHSVSFQYFADFQYHIHEDVRKMINEAKGEARDKIDAIIGSLKSDIDVLGHVGSNNLIDEIREMISRHDFDLVVVGTHGSHGWKEFLTGSNTEKIVRRISIPVIAVPAKVTSTDIRKILVPLDLREIRRGFFDEVAKLQRSFSAALEFVWIKTPHNIESDEIVTQELTILLKEQGVENFSFSIDHEIFPSDGILKHAKETAADMIAMATHGRRGISHWLSGSLTEDTLNHIHIPVWAFKLDKQEKPIVLTSVKEAKGKPLYKDIKTPMK